MQHNNPAQPPSIRTHTNVYRSLTFPDGRLVMMPIVCKQGHLSWLENHDEQPRKPWTFVRHPLGSGRHIVCSSLRRLFARFGEPIPIYPAFTGRFLISARPRQRPRALGRGYSSRWSSRRPDAAKSSAGPVSIAAGRRWNTPESIPNLVSRTHQISSYNSR